MPCEHTCEELAALAAGDLPPARAEELSEHAAGCPDCRRRIEALERTDAALAALRPAAPPAAAVLAARRALAREVRGAGPEVMTLEEVARFLRVSPGELSDLVGELPAFEIAGRLRVRRSRLVAWIEEREKQFARGRLESEVAHILAGAV